MSATRQYIHEAWAAAAVCIVVVAAIAIGVIRSNDQKADLRQQIVQVCADNHASVEGITACSEAMKEAVDA